MAFLDKLSNLATTAGEKASSAIEIGRLNLRQNAEEKKIETATFQIGASLLFSLDAGSEYDEVIMALYEEIKSSRAALVTLRNDIATLSGNLICDSCTAKNPLGSRFCRECGTNLEEAAKASQIEANVEPSLVSCPSCGTVTSANESFCNQCGTKLDCY